MMRNWVSFHYGEQLRDALGRLPGGTQVNIWFARSPANDRFDIGSIAASLSMNAEFTKPDGTTGYQRFLDEVMDVHEWMLYLLNALMLYLLDPLLERPSVPLEAPGGGPQSVQPFLDEVFLGTLVEPSKAS